jgi:hypothetical protein
VCAFAAACAHPYALFDEVVLVRLELVLQPLLLLLLLARLALGPRRVEQRGGVLGRDGAEVLDERRIHADVLAALGFGDGQAVRVGREVGRQGADVVEAVDAREAGVIGQVRVEVELGRLAHDKLARGQPVLEKGRLLCIHGHGCGVSVQVHAELSRELASYHGAAASPRLPNLTLHPATPCTCQPAFTTAGIIRREIRQPPSLRTAPMSLGIPVARPCRLATLASQPLPSWARSHASDRRG